MATLQTALQNIAAYLNQDPTLPSGTDLTSWSNIINQAQNEWADTYQWSILRKPITPSFTASGASIALPGNFKKLMSPLFDYSTSTPTLYEEIDPSTRYYRNPTDRYCYIIEDSGSGSYMTINPAPASGASLSYDMQFAPSSLATTTDIITCPSIQYITLKSISKILSARSDPRFTQVKTDADDLMSSMIEEEVAPSGGKTNQTPSQFKKRNFRPGY